MACGTWRQPGRRSCGPRPDLHRAYARLHQNGQLRSISVTSQWSHSLGGVRWGIARKKRNGSNASGASNGPSGGPQSASVSRGSAAPPPPRQRSRPRYRQQRKSSSKRGLWIGGAVVVGIVLLAGIVLQSGSGGGGNFQMTAYNGANQLGGSTVMFDDVKLLAAGKPIVLNLWGGSCPPCRAEMPGFQRAYDRNSDDFLMVGLDVGPFFGLGTRNSAVQLLTDLQITYPTAFATSRDPVGRFGANALPSTFFFDKDGNLDSKKIGFINEQDFEQRLRDLIDEPVASAGVGGGHNG